MKTKFSTMPNSTQVSSQSGNAAVNGTVIADELVVDLPDQLNNEWGSLNNKQIKDEKSRTDIVSHEMGQLLLKGYKMLATTCHLCDCILMEDRAGVQLCIGCNLDNSNTVKGPAQQNKDPESIVVTFKPKKKSSAPKASHSSSAPRNSHSSSGPSSYVVQGVDLSSEMREVVTAIGHRLGKLTQQLYSSDDQDQLAKCLASITSTVSVLEKIRQLSE
ncbi:protein ZNRD2-like [Hyalella azteca]|uniref:Protein ZNRD2-like n=1 Tax=Hyalella azteca TaxID=294128 RepID=A0A8B7P2D3_HYAAZ|nr:protein ZNRD2-like [Hyalella azteca]